ncbi:hypothetical protein [Flavivirga eckloniae]|uniref:PKD domain-containing protein n=1 Tax=Flavivirga eckloniae TaxID=1803846 RepID=A0A2K9PVQ2_9FLAO|nr:hypothetical protein [Flavivirga eckloniae]AUP80587.1 hypothetical protein C1H87_18465 [Flavivirga eckloniae]
MILKNIKFYIATLCTLIILSCTTRDDSFTPPEGTVPVAFIITSIIEANNDRDLITREGFDVEFLDASIGTSDDRQWEFPEGSYEIVSGGLDTKKIKVKFLSSGDKEVKLNKNSAETATVTITVLEGASATFSLAPVDPDVPGFSFDQTTGTLTVESGTEVQFTSNVTGGLSNFNWKFPGQSPSFSEEANPIITFLKLGESNWNFRVTSAVPFGDIRIPFYEVDAEETFLKVIVTPSSKPFVVAVSEANELEDETIQIPFNGEFSPFSSQESHFSVMLNGTTPLGIESVSLNSEDATILEIKLSEPIYRPDVLTVSYDGNGTLQSKDTRSPVAFTDLPVAMHNVSSVPMASADIFDFEGINAPAAWTVRHDNVGGAVEISNDRATSGSSSLKITGSGGTVRFVCSENIDVPAGEYIITFDLFIEAGGTYGEIWPTIGNPWFQQWRDARAAAIPRGEWVEVSTTADIIYGSTTTLAQIAVRLEGGTGVVYMDNWKLLTKEVRP